MTGVTYKLALAIYLIVSCAAAAANLQQPLEGVQGGGKLNEALCSWGELAG